MKNCKDELYRIKKIIQQPEKQTDVCGKGNRKSKQKGGDV